MGLLMYGIEFICTHRSVMFSDDVPHPPSLLLIVKWGGELTPAGKVQAGELGKAFRTLYPGGQGRIKKMWR